MSTKAFLGVFGGSMALLFGVIAAVMALPTFAATDYAFTMRGYVESVDATTNKVKVTGTWASTAQGITDMQSQLISYSTTNADIYKWESGSKVLRNINHIKVGQEVVIKGNKKSGSFLADWVVINDNSFEVVGKVIDNDTDEKWIKVKIGRSTLKHAGVVNTEVKFYYDDTAKCKRLGTDIDCSQIVNDKNQGIKLKGILSSTSQRWEITHAWNRYPL